MSRNRTRNVSSASEGTELREGRPEPVLPYSQLGDWVFLALQAKKINHPALSLYWALCMHLNANRAKQGDRKVWPTQATLAEMLGYSEGKKVLRYLRELVAINAIDIIKVPDGGFRERSVYIIHKSPPPDYDGPESLQDFYDDCKARERAARAAVETPADEDSASGEGMDQFADDGSSRSTSTDFPWAQTSPWAMGSNEPMAMGSNEPINKTKEQNEGNKSGGRTAAPRPPADLTAGRVVNVVASELELVSNQQTASAETCAAEFDAIEQDESAGSESAGREGPPSTAEPSGVQRSQDDRFCPPQSHLEANSAGRNLTGKRSRTNRGSAAAPALFDAPGTRRAPRPDCAGCDGESWLLDPDGAPVEPAVRCGCTKAAHSPIESPEPVSPPTSPATQFRGAASESGPSASPFPED
jgi:hypothetical protein